MEKFDFGEAIGIIVWKSWVPAIRHGHHAYATTYDFPVRFKFIENFRAPADKKEEWRGWNFSEHIRAAKELEDEGVAAISTCCGLTGIMQKELTNAVNIPVFTSSLLQVPYVYSLLRKDKKVGILTHSSDYAKAQNCRLLRDCGIGASIPVVVYGMHESEFSDLWNTQFKGMIGWDWQPTEEYEPEKVGAAMASVAKKMVTENPDVGAIVLECTEMPLYAASIREATGLLVFDSTTQVRHVYHAIVKSKYF